MKKTWRMDVLEWSPAEPLCHGVHLRNSNQWANVRGQQTQTLHPLNSSTPTNTVLCLCSVFLSLPSTLTLYLFSSHLLFFPLTYSSSTLIPGCGIPFPFFRSIFPPHLFLFTIFFRSSPILPLLLLSIISLLSSAPPFLHPIPLCTPYFIPFLLSNASYHLFYTMLAWSL